MRSEPNCTDCALAIDGDLTEGGPGTVKVSASSFSLGSELDDMLGLPGFEMAVAGDWRRRGVGTGRARLDIELTRIETPASESTLAARLGAWAEGGGYRGRIDRLLATSGGRSLELDGAGFLLPGDVGEYFADLWLPAFSPKTWRRSRGSPFGVDHPVGRWLHNLAPRGRIDGFRARIDAEGAAFVCRGRDAAFTSYRGVPTVENAAFVASGNTRAIRVDVDGYDLSPLPCRALCRRTRRTPKAVVRSRSPSARDTSDCEAIGFGWIAMVRGPSPTSPCLGRRGRTRPGWRSMPGSTGLTLWMRKPISRGPCRRYSRVGSRTAFAPVTSRAADSSSRATSGQLTACHADISRWRPRSSMALSTITTTGRRLAESGPTWSSVERGPLWAAVPGSWAPTSVKSTSASHLRAASVSLRLRTRADAGQLLRFVRLSPVRNAMPFLSDAWAGDGGVVVAAEMVVPLATAGDEVLRPEDLRLEFDLEGTTIDLADLGLRFDDMTDRVSYEWPMNLSSERLTGTLFDAPVELAIESDDETIRFSLQGSASVADAYGVLDLADPGIAEGRFDFDAVFEVFPESEHPAELRIDTDLVGVAAALPTPLDKRTGETSTLAVSLQFLDDYVAVSTRYDDFSGWLHVGDSGILAAALGLGVPVPMADAGHGRVVIAGGLDSVDVSSIVSALGSTTRQEGHGFRLGTARLPHRDGSSSMRWNSWIVRVDGHAQDDGEIRLTLAGRRLARVAWRDPGTGRGGSNLPELTVPASAPSTKDIALGSRHHRSSLLPPTWCNLGGSRWATKDYGTWRFGLRPVAGGHRVARRRRRVARTRASRLTVPGALESRRAPPVSRGHGHTRGISGRCCRNGTSWPSVQSESFTGDRSRQLAGLAVWTSTWRPFPVQRDRWNWSSGRFLDIEQGAGAARIMSLINFSTIVKRISLDFTDVFGRGLSFDRALADLSLTDGLARDSTARGRSRAPVAGFRDRRHRRLRQ